MADIDVLPQRGVHPLALVGANGIAIGGSATVAQLAAKGMQSICQVDATGIASSDGSSTVAQLAAKGIRTFAAVDELGVSTDDAVSKADAIRMRGIRPMVAVDANGVSQTGSATIPTLAQRGLGYFCPVDETGTAASLIPVPPNTIRARPGIFAFTGESMVPTTGWVLPVGAGAFPFAGQSAALTPPVAATTTWDAAHKDPSLTLSNGNLTSKNTVGSAFAAVRSVASHTTGKYYCELHADVQNFAGFSQFGICTAAIDLSSSLGSTVNGMISSGNGQFVCNATLLSSVGDGYGATGQTCGMAVDLTTKKMWTWNSDLLRWNGDILANQNPATGVGGINFSAQIAAGPYFLVNAIWQANDQTTINFGATAYVIGTPPAGFGNW